MTGKKRIRYEQIPYFWTEMFDLNMDFVGDFSVQPTRVDLKGTYAKKKFIARYYQGEKLRAILFASHAARSGSSQEQNCARRSGNSGIAGDRELRGSSLPQEPPGRH